MHETINKGRLLVTIMDAASILSVGRSTIYKLITSGDLTVVKLGGSARITTESIRALVGANDNASTEA